MVGTLPQFSFAQVGSKMSGIQWGSRPSNLIYVTGSKEMALHGSSLKLAWDSGHQFFSLSKDSFAFSVCMATMRELIPFLTSVWQLYFKEPDKYLRGAFPLAGSVTAVIYGSEPDQRITVRLEEGDEALILQEADITALINCAAEIQGIMHNEVLDHDQFVARNTMPVPQIHIVENGDAEGQQPQPQPAILQVDAGNARQASVVPALQQQQQQQQQQARQSPLAAARKEPVSSSVPSNLLQWPSSVHPAIIKAQAAFPTPNTAAQRSMPVWDPREKAFLPRPSAASLAETGKFVFFFFLFAQQPRQGTMLNFAGRQRAAPATATAAAVQAEPEKPPPQKRKRNEPKRDQDGNIIPKRKYERKNKLAAANSQPAAAASMPVLQSPPKTSSSQDAGKRQPPPPPRQQQRPQQHIDVGGVMQACGIIPEEEAAIDGRAAVCQNLGLDDDSASSTSASSSSDFED